MIARSGRVGPLAVGLVLLAGAALAQQLEPRAYAPNPVGVNIVGLPFVYQTGSVVTDPSLPVSNVDAKVDIAAAFYDRTFSFFGRSASALLTIPYVWAKVTGDVGEQQRDVTRSGQGDMQLRFATNILGAPALTPQEFARTPPGTTLGASLVVSMPTGQSTTARSSSTSGPIAGRSSRRSASFIPPASGSSSSTRGSGSSRRTTTSSAATAAPRSRSSLSRGTSFIPLSPASGSLSMGPGMPGE